MKPERLCTVLLCLLLAGAAGAEPAKGLDAPTGLTLQARGGGRYQLLWDPIYRDTLMGYSVWLRRTGDREFTRLSVPVKVGKEIRKVPLTSEARLTLALGETPRDLELTVLAEYEDGSSPRSASVFTRRAAAGPASAPAPAGPSAAANAAAAVAEEDAQAGAKPAAPNAFDRPLPDAGRPLLTPLGGLRTELGLDFEQIRSIRGGYNKFSDLRLYGTGIDPAKVVNWTAINVRTEFVVPLTLRWGVLPGIEAWGQASYHAEDMYLNTYIIDGQNFDDIPFVTTDAQGNLVHLSNPTSAGFGDSQAGLRLQPVGAWPLVLGAAAEIPTGAGRFGSMLDWYAYKGSPAGTGLGVARIRGELEWGAPGRRQGLSFHGSYAPAVTERVRSATFSEYILGAAYKGSVQEHVVVHGSETQAGGAYTLPWNLGGRDGAAAVGIDVTSIDAARWTVQGINVPDLLFSPPDLSHVAAHSGLKFVRDDQIEISLKVWQDLPNGFRTGGRVSYVSAVQGDILRLSGQFYY